MDQKQAVRLILVLVAVFIGIYLLYQSWWYIREHTYDKEIRAVATQYGVSPYLVKAVVWRESRFRRFCLGPKGDVGLMQVTQGAVKEWSQAQKQPMPSKMDLFKPSVNLQVGAWYLARALDRWKDRDNPVPFALAEYNAGHSNAAKWASQGGAPRSGREFVPHIGIASTRRYVQDVMAIERKLERRGHL